LEDIGQPVLKETEAFDMRYDAVCD
jgi:hypothetical protein